MITLSTNQFSYRDNTFAVEASDIPEMHDRMPQELMLKSARTGVEKKFVLIKRATDGEGDVLWWRYCSEGGLYIKVFND